MMLSDSSNAAFFLSVVGPINSNCKAAQRQKCYRQMTKAIWWMLQVLHSMPAYIFNTQSPVVVVDMLECVAATELLTDCTSCASLLTPREHKQSQLHLKHIIYQVDKFRKSLIPWKIFKTFIAIYGAKVEENTAHLITD